MFIYSQVKCGILFAAKHSAEFPNHPVEHSFAFLPEFLPTSGVLPFPPSISASRPLGPFINNVRTEGEGGAGPKADIVREVA